MPDPRQAGRWTCGDSRPPAHRHMTVLNMRQPSARHASTHAYACTGAAACSATVQHASDRLTSEARTVMRARPAPGWTVDLRRLHAAVEARGGEREVAAAGAWPSVSAELGLDDRFGYAGEALRWRPALLSDFCLLESAWGVQSMMKPEAHEARV